MVFIMIKKKKIKCRSEKERYRFARIAQCLDERKWPSFINDANMDLWTKKTHY